MATVVLSFLQKLTSFAVSLPVIGRFLDVCLATMPLFLRFGAGAFAPSNISECKRPKKRLILYEYEGCPFCRKVRETLSTLCLEVEIRPCPRETFSQYGHCDLSRFRPEVAKHPKGGHLRFPFLIDEGNNVAMYDSDDIIKYLWQHYGHAADMPISLFMTTIPPFTYFSFLACAFRLSPSMGWIRTPSKKPEKLLELWGFESSPFCRIVRETLCTLEIPYILHNIPHYAVEKRLEFAKKFNNELKLNKNGLPLEGATRLQLGMGKFPWLVDPNTNVSMDESGEIVKYLLKQYKIGEIDMKEAGNISHYSTKGASKDHGTIYGGVASNKQDKKHQ